MSSVHHRGADSGRYHLWALKLIHRGLVRKGYWYNLEIPSCEKLIDYKRENGKFEIELEGTQTAG